MPGPPLPRVALGLVLLAGGAAALEAYQGMGSHRPARRVKPVETNLPPITVDFRDVAAEAGLVAPNVSGGESAKKYILETTGSGVAVLDYDGDGLMDLFLANGTTLDGEGAGAKYAISTVTSRLSSRTSPRRGCPVGWGRRRS